MMPMMDGKGIATVPYAPPFLKAGKLVIGQTANILLFLGARHGLAPKTEAGRLWVHQLQLTVADFVKEVHDTHHPIAASLYYEDQKPEAKRFTYTSRHLHTRGAHVGERVKEVSLEVGRGETVVGRASIPQALWL